ncbi:hypothetical protein [Thalassotalea eurytherma]|uniref:Uncharacterized protein n=1 Tax=Thalassotalea eurytherma TaxID=1144278 RepID=A0ABQ6H3C1_9GAMM|nr:hypothetical protein [Thalassotalea eurytherma]GLX82673.1 hypothetical protein theurythT_21250 [Thalassotalea eurytherma]
MPTEQSTKDKSQLLVTKIELAFNTINQPRVTSDLEWEWDAKHQVILTHFARNFAQDILTVVERNVPDTWHSKNIKKAPNSLREQFTPYGKLSTEQKIFTMSATKESPGLILIWWPWGHGNTYSLRIGLLDTQYDLANHAPQPWWQRLFS